MRKALLVVLFAAVVLRVSASPVNLLFFPPFARPAGMAEAYTALSSGTYGLYYNPAGLVDILGFEAQYTHLSWFQFINYDYFSIINPDPVLDWGKIGIAFGAYTQERPRTVFDKPYVDWGGEELGFYTISNYFVTIGAAMNFGKDLSVGLNAKLNSQYVKGAQEASDLSLDLGVLYKTRAIGPPLRVGAVMTGTGARMRSEKSALTLPLNARIGIAQELDFDFGFVTLSTDALFDVNDTALFCAGVEYEPFDFLFVRGGYKMGKYNQLSLGAGFKLDSFQIHYAYENHTGWGPVHYVSALISWWAPPVFITAEPRVFAPNGDGAAESVTVTVKLREQDKILSVHFNIYDETGGVLLERVRLEHDKWGQFVWDGKVKGQYQKSKGYMLSVAAEYPVNGASESAKTQVKTDFIPPRVSVKGEPEYLKPGEDAALLIPSTFTFFAADTSGIDSWEFVIYDYQKKPFYKTSGKGEPPLSYIWDGQGTSGEYVNTGELYYYSLSAVDSMGNSAVTRAKPQVILLKEIKLTYSSDALFDPGKYEVKASAYNSLKKIKPLLEKYPESEFIIAGHTDDREAETPEKRQKLSEQRAKAVRFYLVNLIGIKKKQIETLGFGGTIPVEKNDDEKARAKNRRVEAVIRSTIYK